MVSKKNFVILLFFLLVLTSLVNGAVSHPVMNSSRISPVIAYSTSVLLGYCNATDSTTGDSLAYNYEWYKNGVLNVSGTLFKDGSISVGYSHTCGVRANDSRVLCWGDGAGYRLGDGYTADNTVPGLVNDTSAYLSVGTGTYHTCGVRASDGRVLCCGMGNEAQMGDGTYNSNYNLNLTSDSSAYSSVSAGTYHSCGIRLNDSRVLCWGRGSDGQLGDGITLHEVIPTLTNDSSAYSSVSAGSYHTCGVRSDGRVLCWGDGYSSIPGLVNDTSAYSSVNCGWAHSCGIRLNDSRVLCWGRGSEYQLGDDSTSSSSVPVLTNDSSAYSSVSAGTYHTCGVRSGGRALCWGDGTSYKLGDDSTVTNTVPGLTNDSSAYSSVSVGDSHSCGVRLNDSRVLCWGSGSNYQMGDDSTDDNTVPSLTSDSSAYEARFEPSIEGLINMLSESLTSDGDVWILGCQANDSLGENSSWLNSTSVRVNNVPVINVTKPTDYWYNTSDNYVFVNATITDLNFSNASFNWDGVSTDYILSDDGNNSMIVDNTNNDLIMALSFSEGATLIDSSNYGHNATNSGATWTSSGMYSGAYSFDGGDYMDVGNSSDFDFTSGMAISAWVQFTTALGSGNYPTIINKEHGDTWGAMFGTDTRMPRFYTKVGFSFTSITSDTACSYDEWCHVIYTYGNGYKRIYVNNVLTASEVRTGDLNTNTRNVTIGKRTITNQYYFVGLIDELRAYNRSLTVVEIQELYQAGLYKLDSTNYWLEVNKTNLSAGEASSKKFNYSISATDVYDSSNTSDTRYVSVYEALVINVTEPTDSWYNTSDDYVFVNISISGYNISNATINWSDNLTTYNLSDMTEINSGNYTLEVNMTDLDKTTYTYIIVATNIDNVATTSETMKTSTLQDVPLESVYWNVDYAYYNDNSLSTSAQSSSVGYISLSPDGTILMAASIGGDVFQYNLSDPFNISSAVFETNYSNFLGVETSTSGLFVNPNGTKVFLVGYATDRVYEIDLSTGWDLSTAVYNSVNYTPSEVGAYPIALTFDSTGTKFYLHSLKETAYQYNMTTAWDISTASYSGNNFAFGTYGGLGRGLYISQNTQYFYFLDDEYEIIYQFTINESGNIDTCVYDTNFSMNEVAHPSNSIRSMWFDDTGSIMYVAASGTSIVYEFPIDLGFSSITINSPVNYQAFQRNTTTNESDISVNISAENRKDYSVEVNFDDNGWETIGVIGNDTYLVTNYTASVDSGALVIRLVTDTDTNSTIDNVLIGDIYLTMGQSNAAGHGQHLNLVNTSLDYISAKFQQTLNDTYYTLAVPISGSWQLGNDAVGNDASTFGSEWSIAANALIPETNIPIAWISGTKGGTLIAAWAGVGTTWYDRAFTLVEQTGLTRIRGVLWHQGESDQYTDKDYYYDKLQALYNNLTNDIDFDYFMVAPVSKTLGRSLGTQEAQRQFAEDNDGVVLGPETYDIYKSIDGVHYQTDAEMGAFGERWYKVIGREFYDLNYTQPDVVSAIRVNNTLINITFNDVLNISYWNGTQAVNISGLVINDSGSVVTPSSMVIVGKVLQLNFGSVLTSSIMIDYANANTTYNLPALRSDTSDLPALRIYDLAVSSGDSCTYSGGNWVITDNCTATINTNVLDNNFTLSDGYTFYTAFNITNISSVTINGGELTISSAIFGIGG